MDRRRVHENCPSLNKTFILPNTEGIWSRFLKMLLSLSILCLLFSFNFLSLFAQNNVLESLFGIERPKTKNFIIVDVSGSMRPYFHRVIQGLNVIPRALCAEDSVAIYKFATYPGRICGKRANEISIGDFPETYAKGYDGQYTDIWAILEILISEMESSHQEVFTIFFLTDGRDEPPPNSDRSGERWQQIRNSAYSILSQKAVIAYGIGLGAHTDVNLLRSIFGNQNVEILIQSPYALHQTIQRVINDVRRRWLREVVRKEINSGKVEVIQKGFKEKRDKVLLNYEVRSHYPHLPIEVPKEEGEKLTIHHKKPGRFSVCIRKPFLNPRAIGRRIYKLNDREIPISVSFLHQNEINELGLLPEVKVLRPERIYHIKYGIPISFLVFLLLSLVVLFIFGKKWLSLPPITVYGTISCPSQNIGKSLEIQRKRVSVGGNKNDDIMISGLPPGSFELEVKREKGWDILSISPSESIQLTLDGELLMGKRELSQNVHQVMIGDTKIFLNNVSPRKVKERGTFKFIILTLFLMAFNFELLSKKFLP